MWTAVFYVPIGLRRLLPWFDQLLQLLRLHQEHRRFECEFKRAQFHTRIIDSVYWFAWLMHLSVLFNRLNIRRPKRTLRRRWERWGSLWHSVRLSKSNRFIRQHQVVHQLLPVHRQQSYPCGTETWIGLSRSLNYQHFRSQECPTGDVFNPAIRRCSNPAIVMTNCGVQQ